MRWFHARVADADIAVRAIPPTTFALTDGRSLSLGASRTTVAAFLDLAQRAPHLARVAADRASQRSSNARAAARSASVASAVSSDSTAIGHLPASARWLSFVLSS